MSSLQNKFDLAKKEFDIKNHTYAGGTQQSGYIVEGRKPYLAYRTKEEWALDLDKIPFKDRYKGGGNELIGCPPPMASYGSSSRYILFESLGNFPDFLPEESLKTKFGGCAKVDGYLSEHNTYIEAKCREIYVSPATKWNDTYIPLFNHLTEMMPNVFAFEKRLSKKGNPYIDFSLEHRKLQGFDIKQILCHLLGIINRYKDNCDTKVSFIYLLYNPSCLSPFLNNNKQKIEDKYKIEIDEATTFGNHYKEFVFHISRFMKIAEDAAETLSHNFTFLIYDQYKYRNFAKEY